MDLSLGPSRSCPVKELLLPSHKHPLITERRASEKQYFILFFYFIFLLVCCANVVLLATCLLTCYQRKAGVTCISSPEQTYNRTTVWSVAPMSPVHQPDIHGPHREA